MPHSSPTRVVSDRADVGAAQGIVGVAYRCTVRGNCVVGVTDRRGLHAVGGVLGANRGAARAAGGVVAPDRDTVTAAGDVRGADGAAADPAGVVAFAVGTGVGDAGAVGLAVLAAFGAVGGVGVVLLPFAGGVVERPAPGAGRIGLGRQCDGQAEREVERSEEHTSVVEGKRGSGRVDLGG